MNVGGNVKEIIKSRGLKQGIVAEKAGYTYKRFNDLLNGRKVISSKDVYKLCNALGITPNDLFGFTKPENPQNPPM